MLVKVGGYYEEYHSSLFTQIRLKNKNNYKNKQTITCILLTVEICTNNYNFYNRHNI